MYPKKACMNAVSESETERKSGVKQIGLVGARVLCGSDSCWAVSRGNQTSQCGSLFCQPTPQQKALTTQPLAVSLYWPMATVREGSGQRESVETAVAMFDYKSMFKFFPVVS